MSPVAEAVTDKPDERLTCVVSHFVFRAEAWPRCARRDAPVDERDSGWMFLSGHPDEDRAGFGDDPTNWRRVMLGELIAAFPGVAALVDEVEGTEWDWDDASQTYRRSLTA